MTAEAVTTSRFTLHLDLEFGTLTLAPDWTPSDLRKALRRLDVLGWDMLDMDETGDEPEELEDGSIVLPVVPRR